MIRNSYQNSGLNFKWKFSFILFVVVLAIFLVPIIINKNLEKKFSPTTSNLVAYYQFEGNVKDSSTWGNNGISRGTLSYIPGKTLSYIPGKVAQAVRISNGGYIEVPYMVAFNSQAGTLSFWLKKNSASNGNYFIYADDSTGKRFFVSLGADNKIYFKDDGTACESLRLSSSVAPNWNEWHHVAITWGNNEAYQKVYIDGVDRTQYIYINGVKQNKVCSGGQSYRQSIGSYFGQYGTDISLDHFVLYNSVKSASQVLQLYNDVATCPLNQVWDSIKSKCVCADNFQQLNGGECSPRPIIPKTATRISNTRDADKFIEEYRDRLQDEIGINFCDPRLPQSVKNKRVEIGRSSNHYFCSEDSSVLLNSPITQIGNKIDPKDIQFLVSGLFPPECDNRELTQIIKCADGKKYRTSSDGDPIVLMTTLYHNGYRYDLPITLIIESDELDHSTTVFCNYIYNYPKNILYIKADNVMITTHLLDFYPDIVKGYAPGYYSSIGPGFSYILDDPGDGCSSVIKPGCFYMGRCTIEPTAAWCTDSNIIGSYLKEVTLNIWIHDVFENSVRIPMEQWAKQNENSSLSETEWKYQMDRRFTELGMGYCEDKRYLY